MTFFPLTIDKWSLLGHRAMWAVGCWRTHRFDETCIWCLHAFDVCTWLWKWCRAGGCPDNSGLGRKRKFSYDSFSQPGLEMTCNFTPTPFYRQQKIFPQIYITQTLPSPGSLGNRHQIPKRVVSSPGLPQYFTFGDHFLATENFPLYFEQNKTLPTANYSAVLYVPLSCCCFPCKVSDGWYSWASPTQGPRNGTRRLPRLGLHPSLGNQYIHHSQLIAASWSVQRFFEVFFLFLWPV